MIYSAVYDKFGNKIERIGIHLFLKLLNKNPRYIGCLKPDEGLLVCCKEYERDIRKDICQGIFKTSSSLMTYGFSHLLIQRSQLFYKIVIVEYFDAADYTGALSAKSDDILKHGKVLKEFGEEGSFTKQIFYPRYLFENQSHNREKYVTYLRSQVTFTKESTQISFL